MDQRTFDIKVKELAEKLKSTGVVTSDAMAKNMAADIIKTEQATREKYEQPKQEQKQPQQESSSNTSDAPKNMVVEEAIKNAQGAAHQARVDDGIDQEKSISELLDEEPQEQKTQPKVTLDNPVVENGVSRQEKESEPADFGIKQTPPEARGSGAPTPAIDPKEPEMPSPEPVATPNPTPQPQQASEPQPQKQPEQKSEEKPQEAPAKKDQPEVDLTEMFNFSKK